VRPVLIEILLEQFIAFNLGTHPDIVRMSYADFERLASPAFASIFAPQEVPV